MEYWRYDGSQGEDCYCHQPPAVKYMDPRGCKPICHAHLSDYDFFYGIHARQCNTEDCLYVDRLSGNGMFSVHLDVTDSHRKIDFPCTYLLQMPNLIWNRNKTDAGSI